MRCGLSLTSTVRFSRSVTVRAQAEEARKEELRAYCQKKGLDFSAEEAKYQNKLAEKKAKAEAKAAPVRAKRVWEREERRERIRMAGLS